MSNLEKPLLQGSAAGQGEVFASQKATDVDTSNIYTSLVNEDVNDAKYGWKLLCEKIDPKDGTVLVRLHCRPWLGLGTIQRLECTYRGCTLNGVTKALEDMLENGAPELGAKTTNLKKYELQEPAGLLPVGANVNLVYQEMAAMCCCMNPRDNLLRFASGFIDPPPGSQADKGSKVFFDTQTSFTREDYPVKPGVIRMNQAKTTTYEQRGPDVYSIEFMYNNMGGWMGQTDFLMSMIMPNIIKELTKKYSAFK